MKLIALVLFAISLNAMAASPTGEKGRFDMVPATSGRVGVFKLDREAGQVWFCYYWTEMGANGLGQAPAGVLCVPEAK